MGMATDKNFSPSAALAETPAVIESSPRNSGSTSRISKLKVVEKVLDLPVVSDTYNFLAKMSLPLVPVVEKIGSMASSVLDQTRDFKAGIEAKVPDVVKTGYSSALAQVIVAYYTQWLLEKVLYFILIILGQHCRPISGR